MSDRNVRVSVRILEKEYQVACLPEERSELLDSAEFLNAQDARDPRRRQHRRTGSHCGDGRAESCRTSC